MTTDAPQPEPDAESAPPSASAVFAEGMAGAARRAGFSAAAEGKPISGKALLAAMGGIRGLIEAVVPGLVFLVIYTVTAQIVPALLAPVVLGLVFVALRAASKQTMTPAIGGLIGTGISAALALFSGNAADFFLVGFWTNAIYGLVLLVSVFVRWPLIGLAVGFLMGDGVGWRADASKRRVMNILTLSFAGLFFLRLFVQVPLYLANNVDWLAATKLLMGIPLYAPLLVLSWLLVRSVYGKANGTATGAPADPAH